MSEKSLIEGPVWQRVMDTSDMKTALLIFLFVVGTLAFKQVWDRDRSLQEKWMYGGIAVTSWIGMAIVDYVTR